MGVGFDDLGFYGMDITDENLGPDSFVPGGSGAEEGALLDHVLGGIEEVQILDKLKESLKQVGQQSLQRIVLATEDSTQINSAGQDRPGPDFSDRQKEMLSKLFQ